MIRGSCGCGAIQFELTSPPTMLAMCHCSRCRKLGAGSFVFVDRASFRWLAGAAMVERLVPVPPFKYVRSFCRACGTALGEIGSDAESFPVNAHCLDDDPGMQVRFHEFVADKPAWSVIGDDARQFAGHPAKD